MEILNDTPLMIARGQLSTMRRECNAQKKAVATIAGTISNLAIDSNRRVNDDNPLGAKLSLANVENEAAALRSLCDSIDALQAQMKPLQALAWPSGKVNE